MPFLFNHGSGSAAKLRTLTFIPVGRNYGKSKSNLNWNSVTKVPSNEWQLQNWLHLNEEWFTNAQLP